MVGLQKKSGRTIFCPYHVVGNQLEATYKLQMTGERLAYWARQKLRVQYPVWGDTTGHNLEVFGG